MVEECAFFGFRQKHLLISEKQKLCMSVYVYMNFRNLPIFSSFSQKQLKNYCSKTVYMNKTLICETCVFSNDY